LAALPSNSNVLEMEKAASRLKVACAADETKPV